MEKEFQDIINRHKGILYKIGRSYTTEEADFEDLYQEMLIQLWKSMSNFKEESKLSTWIYRVALNTALTYKRSKKKKGRIGILEDGQFSNTLEDGEHLDDLKKREIQLELLYKCINQLKKEDRAIILLHLDGNKYEEIGSVLGITVNHVGVKINRIKSRLTKLLKEHGYGRI